MTALSNAMATRNRFLTTAKAPVRALRQAEFERPAADSAPFYFTLPHGLSIPTLRSGGRGAMRSPSPGMSQADFLWKSRICSGVNLFNLTTRAFPARNGGMVALTSDSLPALTIA